MPKVIVDAESRSLQEHYAVVNAKRRNRPRFPEGCVHLVADESKALEAADVKRHLYPALVYGPSVSSEGQRVYYLINWLDEPDSSCR